MPVSPIDQQVHLMTVHVNQNARRWVAPTISDRQGLLNGSSQTQPCRTGQRDSFPHEPEQLGIAIVTGVEGIRRRREGPPRRLTPTEFETIMNMRATGCVTTPVTCHPIVRQSLARARARHEEDAMSIQSLSRLVGPVSIAASALIIVSQLLNLGLGLALGGQSADNIIHTLKNGLAILAMYVLLLSLTGLYLRQAESAGKLGLAGYLVAFLGTLLVAGDWWFESFIAPRIAAVAPEVMTGAITGSMAVGAGATFGLFALGWTLFGVATFRAKVYPRLAAALLIVGGVVGILAGSTPYQIPLAVAVGWIGFFLTRSEQTKTVGPPPGMG
jgi:hypothetical protein